MACSCWFNKYGGGEACTRCLKQPASGSLDHDVVLDILDALDRRSDLGCALGFGLGVGKAAQLNGALVGLDADLQCADRLVLDEQALDLGGDDTVVHDLTKAGLRALAGTSGGQCGGADGQQEYGGEDGCVSLHG